MLFPVCVHKDHDSDFGITIPDIPGCFTAGVTLEEAISNVQEAVEVHCQGERFSLKPSPLDDLFDDPLCHGGFWVMVDIDLSFMAPKHKRVNITIPEHVLNKADLYARRHKLTRSALITKALQSIVNQ